MSDQTVDTLIAIGQAGVNWRHLAEQMERQRNEAFAALAESTAREAALAQMLNDLRLDAQEYANNGGDVFRLVLLERCALAQQQPAAASTTGGQRQG